MSSSKNKRQRITMKLETPNPLFLGWLTEWQDRAKEKESKMQYSLKMAIKSLEQYPLPMESGKQCKILKGFGDKLCQMLDDKLASYKANGGVIPTFVGAERSGSTKSPIKQSKQDTSIQPQGSSKKGTPNKEYIPKLRSGAYAILVTLYEQSMQNNYPGFMVKTDITKLAQPLCDVSFTKPEAGSFYTAWSSMEILVKKDLVSKQGRPLKFRLTETGSELAERLFIQTKIDALQMDLEETDALENQSPSRQIMNSPLKVSVELPDDGKKKERKNKQRPRQQCNKNGSDDLDILLMNSPSTSRTSLESSPKDEFDLLIAPLNSKTSLESSPKDLIVLDAPAISKTKNADANKRNKQNAKSTVLPRTCSTSSTASSNNANFESIMMAPNSFEIILLVDNQELSKSSNSNLILGQLQKNLTMHQQRDLKVGDYLWIARSESTKTELVLPYVVERKRMDDLGHSIKDGRFHEQKFRLKQSGIQNLIYIVEDHGDNSQCGLDVKSLLQGAINTLVQDEFYVKFTHNLKETVEYLSCMSELLTEQFKNKTLVSCLKEDVKEAIADEDLACLMTFLEFNMTSSKTRKYTVRETFIKQLLQIHGMSVEKALALTDRYPTPKLLRNAYLEAGPILGEKLLAKIQFGETKRNLGPTLSRTIYQFYCIDTYL